MNRSAMYPLDLLGEINKIFASLDERNRPLDFPPHSALGEMLEASFHASLMSEESRRLKFRLGYCDPARLAGIKTPGTRWFAFKKSRECTTAELRRLAPAFDTASSIICCHSQPRLVICGILTAPSDAAAMSSLSVLHGQSLPDVFNISSASPGELCVNCGDASFVQLRGGKLRFPMPLRPRGPIIGHLAPIEDELRKEAWDSILHDCRVSEPPEKPHWVHTPYFPFLAHLLARLERNGHGGSLLIVPPDQVDTLDDGIVRMKYGLENSSAWGFCRDWVVSLLRETTSLRTPTESAKENSSEHRFVSADDQYHSVMRFAGFVADLGNVDGAVVISDRLKIIGFGAEITAHSEQVSGIRYYPDARTDAQAERVDTNGTRHRSVIRFCSAVPGATGFIISQDGGMKAARRSADVVEMWGDVVPAFG